MAILYLCGEVNKELVNQFLEQFNKIKEASPITIYINSEGGFAGEGDAIIDIINCNAKRITLVACGEIASCGFNIFFETKCKKRILEGTTGMAHFSWASFSLNESGQPTTDEDRFLMNTMKSNKAKTIKKFREMGLNRHEIGKINTNREAYFTYERLKELLDGKTT